MFNFDNSYASLPERFYVRLRPTPVAQPGLVRVNRELAEELAIDPDYLESQEGVSILAGNSVPEGADPLAMAYAGHQFGGWVPQLGDGRAILLGEIVDRRGVRRDVQLKGSGRTPFSRQGDGRAWLGPVIREYLVSEAMHALGVPSTRSLAAVTTGEPVFREKTYPGAVLTRVAKGHVRVGTFQYFYARNDTEALQLLVDHTISRLYPEIADATDPVIALLDTVVERQAHLIASWLGFGFIHGVMNTDNVSLACESIDFGPCAFMDNFHPDKVFSSIDHGGRYSYSNQPAICLWNLAQFATTLVPVIGVDKEKAITAATDSINRFQDHFSHAWTTVFCRKLGLLPDEGNQVLVSGFLELLTEIQTDFTVAFRRLACLSNNDNDNKRFVMFLNAGCKGEDWLSGWWQQVNRDGLPEAERQRIMKSANPAIIPRNHLIEQAIDEAVAGDLLPFHRLCHAWTNPFADDQMESQFALPPKPEEVVSRTFCGT